MHLFISWIKEKHKGVFNVNTNMELSISHSAIQLNWATIIFYIKSLPLQHLDLIFLRNEFTYF